MLSAMLKPAWGRKPARPIRSASITRPRLTVIRTVTAGIVGDTWTYDAAMQAADGGPYAVYVEIESVRDGMVSYQHHRFRIQIVTGYGIGYGLNYGGL
jgi:hypothetical protein